MSSKKIIAAGVLLVGVSIALLLLPLGEWLTSIQRGVASLGPAGPVVAASAYVPLAVFLVPASAVSIGVGTVYGLWMGVGIAAVGANLGALCSFLLARTFLREKVGEWAREHPRFQALDRAIEKEGFRTVLLTRLSPAFPFTLLNYFLGLTSISLRSYVLGNLIGMLPGTFLYVFIGASISNGISNGASALKIAVLAGGLVATILVVVLTARAARRAMAEIEQKSGANDQTGIVAAAG